MSGGKAKAWAHFSKQADGSSAKCKLCGVIIGVKGGSTGSMNNHLRLKHASIGLHLEQNAAAGDTNHQPRIGSFFKCTPQRAEKISQLIAEMIVKDTRPLSEVDAPGFRSLMAYIEPSYSVPSRRVITERIHQMYARALEETKDRLGKQEYLAIITDAWTSLAVESYTTVTVHYIDSEWKLHGGVIKTAAMPERHTAENIAARLHDITEEFNMKSKVVACVHDNASNMMAAGRLCSWKDVSCFAHTLQLCVNAGFEKSGLKTTVAAASKVVRFFHRSPVASTALTAKQMQFNAPKHSLVQSCPTRWNSIYYMFERLVEQRWPISAVLGDRSVVKEDAKLLELKDKDWQNISDMIPILKPFQIATQAMSLEQNVSISSVYPIVCGLVANHLQVDAEVAAPVKKFKVTVLEELARRFPNDIESVMVITTALDPRHKHLSFFPPAVHTGVYDKIQQLMIGMAPAPSPDYSEELPEKRPRLGESTESALTFLLGGQYGQEAFEKDELTRYKEDPVEGLIADPCEYWGKNEARFPILAKLAKKHLCIPATSVPSERVFSGAGLLVSKLRNRLMPENVDMLLFLKGNLKF